MRKFLGVRVNPASSADKPEFMNKTYGQIKTALEKEGYAPQDAEATLDRSLCMELGGNGSPRHDFYTVQSLEQRIKSRSSMGTDDEKEVKAARKALETLRNEVDRFKNGKCTLGEFITPNVPKRKGCSKLKAPQGPGRN